MFVLMYDGVFVGTVWVSTNSNVSTPTAEPAQSSDNVTIRASVKICQIFRLAGQIFRNFSAEHLYFPRFFKILIRQFATYILKKILKNPGKAQGDSRR